MIMQKSIIAAKRNAIGNEGLWLHFTKLGFWSTGNWGENYGDLFKTGLLSFQRKGNESNYKNNLNEFSNDSERFYEAASLDEMD